MLIDKLKNYHIILASQSLRRQQLLKELNLTFDVIIRDYDEIYPPDLDGKGIAEYLAHEKAGKFKNEVVDNDIIITADTIVWFNNTVMNKPSDKKEAFDILKTISDNTHYVITGVCILSKFRERTFSETTKVKFDFLSDEEIKYYIDHYKPYDKAGAYGIQEWIGYIGISYIEGSYTNVMGLPVQKLFKELNTFIRNI